MNKVVSSLMTQASNTAFLLPTSLSNACPPSIVFQSLAFMGTSADNNQVSLMAHMSQSTKVWLLSSYLDSVAFVSRMEGHFILQFLSFQSNQPHLSVFILHSFMRQAVRDSFIPCLKVFNSSSSKAECSNFYSFMYLATIKSPRCIVSHGLSFPLYEGQTFEVY